MKNIETSATCSGHFLIEKLDDENNVIETYEKSNLITNYGLKHLCNNGFTNSYIALFSDVGPIEPDKKDIPSDRLMYDSSIHSLATTNRNPNIANKTYTVIHRFEVTIVSNLNSVKEYNRVGIINPNGSDAGIIALSKITNHNGEGISISVIPGDKIKIVYTFTLTVDLSDSTYENIRMGKLGTTNVTIRAGDINNHPDTFLTNGLKFVSGNMYFGNRPLVALDANCTDNLAIANNNGNITNTVSMKNNVATMTTTSRLSWLTPFGTSSQRKDGYDLVVLKSSLFYYQIKFSRSLDYVSSKVDVLFKLNFTLSRTE